MIQGASGGGGCSGYRSPASYEQGTPEYYAWLECGNGYTAPEFGEPAGGFLADNIGGGSGNYDQYFPIGSSFRFGDEFLSNQAGQTATLFGGLPFFLNYQAANTGVQQFPSFDFETVANGLMPQTENSVIADSAETFAKSRLYQGIVKSTWGFLGLMLILAGVVYLAIVATKKGSSELLPEIKIEGEK